MEHEAAAEAKTSNSSVATAEQVEEELLGQLCSLAKGEIGWDAILDSSGVLHVAIRMLSESTVNSLLKHGGDPNRFNDKGQTPLYCLVQEWQEDDVSAWRRPDSRECAYNIFDLLIQYGADPNQGNASNNNNWNSTPLGKAVHDCKADLVVSLLQHGATANNNELVGRAPLESAVHQYLARKQSDRRSFQERQDLLEVIIPALLQQGQADPNHSSSCHTTATVDNDKNDTNMTTTNWMPLDWAAWNGEDALIEVLLVHGADPNYSSTIVADTTGKEAEGSLALYHSVQRGHPQCAQLLLHHGALPGSRLDHKDRTALVLEALGNSTDGSVTVTKEETSNDIITLSLKHYTGELPEIFEIRNLRKLVLTAVDIDHLPSSIGNLQQLRTLQIGDSESPDLASLPAEIGQLSKLHSLWIGNCVELSVLPKEIQDLPNLTNLTIWQCQNIKHIPTHLPHCLKYLLVCRCAIQSLAASNADDDVVLPQGLEVILLDKNPVLYESGESERLIRILQRHESVRVHVEYLPCFPHVQFPLYTPRVLYLSTWNQARGNSLMRHCHDIPKSCWPLLLEQVGNKSPEVWKKEIPKLRASVLFSLLCHCGPVILQGSL